MRNLRNRVIESFGEDDDEKLVKYLDWLRESLVRQEELARRSLLTSLLLVVVFELIVLAPGSELTMGPLKISESAQVLVFFPVVVAYLTLQVTVATRRYGEGQVAFGRLFEKWNPGAIGNKISDAVLPPEPLYFGFSGGSPDAEDKQDNLAGDISLFLTIVVVAIVPVAFEVQAFIALWPDAGPVSPLLWISMALTAGLASLTTVYTAVGIRQWSSL